MRASFRKYHGLGNAYLVLAPQGAAGLPSVAEVRRLCDPRYGIGSDGLLVGPLPSRRAAFALAIFNPDGSQAEKSGNGLRIFARHLFDTARVDLREFTLDTPGGVVTAQVLDNGARVRVGMGIARFPDPAGPALEGLEVEGRRFDVCRVDLGNPHCVVPTAEPTEAIARRYGPSIEHHPSFPHRTNVQFVAVRGPRSLEVQVWERGAGYTLSSGSSACAAAAAMVGLGACDAEVDVRLPGGVLQVSVGRSFDVTQTGAVSFIAAGELVMEQT